MSLFFNGRLHISPATMTRVDDTRMFNANPAVGNVLAVVGTADGGQPKTALRFGAASEAAAVLRGGELLEAVSRAFGGTLETPGPSTIIAVRVQPATRSTLALANAASQTVITLTSRLWGTVANRIRVAIANGTTRGKRLTVKLDTVTVDADNVGRRLLSVRYTGAQASATVTITATGLTLAAPTGSALPEIPFADAPTIAELAERISLTAGWTASPLDGHGDRSSAELDFLAGVDAKDVDVIGAGDLEAIVEWFNGPGQDMVSAAKAAGAGTVPVNIPGSYLTGATTPAATTQDWGDAFTALQQVDAQWLVPASGDPAIHAMAAAHAKFASDILGKERRAIVGTPLGTTDAAALEAARNIGSDRVSLTHLGGFDFDTAGRLKLYGPWIVAAMIGGGFAGVNPGTPMTNKALALRGLERRLRNPTDTDQLLQGGVMPVEDTPTGYRVVQSVTTWLTNRNYNRREASVGAAVDFIARSLREAVAPIIGKKNGPAAMVEAQARASSTLDLLAVPEPQGIGVIVGDRQNPAWRNLRIEADGDVLRIEVECQPVIGVNYIPISIFAVPYRGAMAA
jgi:hypothetical protein